MLQATLSTCKNSLAVTDNVLRNRKFAQIRRISWLARPKFVLHERSKTSDVVVREMGIQSRYPVLDECEDAGASQHARDVGDPIDLIL